MTVVVVLPYEIACLRHWLRKLLPAKAAETLKPPCANSNPDEKHSGGGDSDLDLMTSCTISMHIVSPNPISPHLPTLTHRTTHHVPVLVLVLIITVDSIEKKIGQSTGHPVDTNKYREKNEKFTDKLRGLFEKKTGKKVSYPGGVEFLVRETDEVRSWIFYDTHEFCSNDEHEVTSFLISGPQDLTPSYARHDKVASRHGRDPNAQWRAKLLLIIRKSSIPGDESCPVVDDNIAVNFVGSRERCSGVFSIQRAREYATQTLDKDKKILLTLCSHCLRTDLIPSKKIFLITLLPLAITSKRSSTAFCDQLALHFGCIAYIQFHSSCATLLSVTAHNKASRWISLAARGVDTSHAFCNLMGENGVLGVLASAGVEGAEAPNVTVIWNTTAMRIIDCSTASVTVTVLGPVRCYSRYKTLIDNTARAADAMSSLLTLTAAFQSPRLVWPRLPCVSSGSVSERKTRSRASVDKHHDQGPNYPIGTGFSQPSACEPAPAERLALLRICTGTRILPLHPPTTSPHNPRYR
ncbi:uncharacterized protein MYCFIDRAFT_179641 [Pseudocercospora fijiensis CIRAD86]|uniref:Uncharacterized protein n=1 Tax=Pseudocercospora fijiensis (strain CIRAD86) TaxID=383855 RepID=M3AM48_PSEFD|nr:uncharacterized protein MYCFIDRAFT_179641 [Pseudocercospora fijiensis CIRAD86]EME78203.1 hypothetical protein MYCFIDRAFT_179641 [Pseudocercospora fijiensis CIRAD86]